MLRRNSDSWRVLIFFFCLHVSGCGGCDQTSPLLPIEKTPADRPPETPSQEEASSQPKTPASPQSPSSSGGASPKTDSQSPPSTSQAGSQTLPQTSQQPKQPSKQQSSQQAALRARQKLEEAGAASSAGEKYQMASSAISECLGFPDDPECQRIERESREFIAGLEKQYPQLTSQPKASKTLIEK